MFKLHFLCLRRQYGAEMDLTAGASGLFRILFQNLKELILMLESIPQSKSEYLMKALVLKKIKNFSIH